MFSSLCKKTYAQKRDMVRWNRVVKNRYKGTKKYKAICSWYDYYDGSCTTSIIFNCDNIKDISLSLLKEWCSNSSYKWFTSNMKHFKIDSLKEVIGDNLNFSNSILENMEIF